MGAELEYVAVGGNRQPAAADWNSVGGVLAYGADRNLALWKPLVSPQLPSATGTCCTDSADRMKMAWEFMAFSRVTQTA